MTNAIELEVTPSERLMTEPCSVIVRGVPPGAQTTIEVTLKERSGQSWSLRGVFYADHLSVVDVACDASIAGTYHGVDAEGLFGRWSPPTLMSSWLMARA